MLLFAGLDPPDQPGLAYTYTDIYIQIQVSYDKFHYPPTQSSSAYQPCITYETTPDDRNMNI